MYFIFISKRYLFFSGPISFLKSPTYGRPMNMSIFIYQYPAPPARSQILFSNAKHKILNSVNFSSPRKGGISPYERDRRFTQL